MSDYLYRRICALLHPPAEISGLYWRVLHAPEYYVEWRYVYYMYLSGYLMPFCTVIRLCVHLYPCHVYSRMSLSALFSVLLGEVPILCDFTTYLMCILGLLYHFCWEQCCWMYVGVAFICRLSCLFCWVSSSRVWPPGTAFYRYIHHCRCFVSLFHTYCKLSRVPIFHFDRYCISFHCYNISTKGQQ